MSEHCSTCADYVSQALDSAAHMSWEENAQRNPPFLLSVPSSFSQLPSSCFQTSTTLTHFKACHHGHRSAMHRTRSASIQAPNPTNTHVFSLFSSTLHLFSSTGRCVLDDVKGPLQQNTPVSSHLSLLLLASSLSALYIFLFVTAIPSLPRGGIVQSILPFFLLIHFALSSHLVPFTQTVSRGICHHWLHSSYGWWRQTKKWNA